MVRYYGNKPYKIAVIHGGPGDIGSLKYCAEQLENKIAELEAKLEDRYETV